MYSEAELVKGCRNFDREAQKALYELYIGKMRGVCLRYIHNREDANDILQEGFTTVLTEIRKYSGKGSLEGWIRKIIVFKAINFYKKNKRYNFQTNNIDAIDEENIKSSDSEANDNSIIHLAKEANLSEEELLASLSILDPHYRIVFNLFYFENYSHKEIAHELSIDEKTSRTRLHRSKKILQSHIYELCQIKMGNNQGITISYER